MLAAGIRPIDIAELMGHRDVKTTLTVYAHLINTDDHNGNMTGSARWGPPKLRERHTDSQGAPVIGASSRRIVGQYSE